MGRDHRFASDGTTPEGSTGGGPSAGEPRCLRPAGGQRKVAMFREIPVHDVVEMLRRWQAGQGLRTIEKAVDVDRRSAATSKRSTPA